MSPVPSNCGALELRDAMVLARSLRARHSRSAGGIALPDKASCKLRRTWAEVAGLASGETWLDADWAASNRATSSLS